MTRFACHRSGLPDRGSVVRSAFAAVVAVVLLFAAVEKGLHLRSFHIVIATLRFIPDWAKVILPVGLPIAEVATACLILWPGMRVTGLAVAGSLLVVFTVYLVVQVFDPIAGTCRCFGNLSVGSTARRENAAGAVRNVLLLAAVWLARPSNPSSRQTQGAWSERANCAGRTAARAGGRSHRPAFTLVETLVVIGVFAVLVAVLLPALSASRRAAQRVQCADNLRSVGIDAAVWAADHHGYLPLDGEATVPDLDVAAANWPAALGDSDRSRYAYHRTATEWGREERPISLPVTFLVAAVPRATADAWTGVAPWSAIAAAQPAARRYRCPSAAGDDNLAAAQAWPDVYELTTLALSMPGETDMTTWNLVTDYGTNGGLLGYDFDPSHAHRRYAGLTTRARSPSTLVLATDAAGRFANWVPLAGGSSATVTLADALAGDPEMWDANPRFDRDRHQGRANVLLLDGHVACVPIDARSLAAYDLLRR